MKLLYFHQHFSTPKGAAGIRSYEMARRLVARGHKVTMVCGSYGGGKTGLSGPFKNGRRQGMVDGIDVIEFNLAYSNKDGLAKRTWTFVKFGWHSLRLSLTASYDVLFATTTPLTAGLPGIAARWLRGKPFVFEVRDLWPELPRAMGVIRNPFMLAAMSVLEWLSYHSAHRLIGLSPGIVEGIARRRVSRDRIALVPNGCDMEIFNGAVESWRPEGVSASDLLAVFAGTHGVANGLDAIVDAAVELQRRGRLDIKIVLIGEGKCKSNLVARARNEGLKNLIFHEPVDKARLAGLLSATDLGLQILANVPAFYYGTSPNKFFDYISAGIPVLNNYPGWLAELITRHNCGFVVSPDDSGAFADALEQAADGRHILKTMSACAKTLAEREFARSLLSNKWAEWVEGACKGDQRAS